MRRIRIAVIFAVALGFTPSTHANDHFISWVNSIRAKYGLRSVAHDPNLDAWAHANNIQQAARGLGHFVLGHGGRQNSGWGAYETVLGMWLQSPGHLSAIIDPSITHVGIAGDGAYWTMNASAQASHIAMQAPHITAQAPHIAERSRRRSFGRWR